MLPLYSVCGTVNLGIKKPVHFGDISRALIWKMH